MVNAVVEFAISMLLRRTLSSGDSLMPLRAKSEPTRSSSKREMGRSV